MKKLLIAASLAATALGATSLMADSGHQHGRSEAGAASGCAGQEGRRGEQHAQMQKQMQEMHARMGSHERQGRGPRAQEEHRH